MSGPALPLPNEIWILILELVHARDLVRCRQLCQSIKDIVDTEVALQYRLALAVANMEDGLSGLRPPAERLDVLQKHQAAWAALKGVQRQEHIPMDADGYWELSGNILAQQTDPTTIEYCPIITGSRETLHRAAWKIHLPFRIEDFTIDPDQDLLVALEPAIVELGSSDTSTSIRILSMETGHPHSKTTTPLLQTQKSTRPSPVCYHVRIRGDYLGILYTESQDCELRIWHWKTGQLCLNLAHPQIGAFAFIDECYCLLAFHSMLSTEDAEAAPPSIQILRFVDLEGRPLDGSKSTPQCRVLALELPRPLQSAYVSSRLSMYENSLSSRPQPSATHGIFRTSQEDRLHVLTMRVSKQWGPNRFLILCIPNYTLEEHIARAIDLSTSALTVPWKEWGPAGSRLFFDDHMNLSSTWICTAYGSRAIASHMYDMQAGEDDPGNYGMRLILRDFGRLAVRRGLAHRAEPDHTDPHHHWHYTDVTEDAGGLAEYFEDDVSTRLPYRWTSRTLRIPYEDQTDHYAMLAEDAIILVDTEDITNRHMMVLEF